MAGARIVHVFAVVLVAANLAWPAAAREPGAAFQYPNGTGLGTPLGTNPPPGVYLSNVANYYANSSSAANATLPRPGVNLTAFAEVPKLVWSTPWTLFGAAVTMHVAQPVVDMTVTNKSGTYRATGLADTVFAPVNLSWALGGGWNLAGIFIVLPPNGQYNVTHKANIGANFWTFQPESAISYLTEDYDITLNAVYNINSENTKTLYTSGDQIMFEVYASKFIGKYQVGVVTYYDKQVTADVNAGSIFPKTNLTSPQQFAAGGLVGYNFGPVRLQAWLTRDVQAKDGGGQGTRFWTRLLIPLY